MDEPTATPPSPPPAAPPSPPPASPPPASPEWQGGLPEDLRADATLSRYKTVEELARGHIEAHRLAKQKAVPLPGDTDESRKAFADALRPETVDAYDFGEVPPVVDGKLVDGFKEFAFETGLPPHLAKGTLDFYAGVMAKQVEEANAASLADVNAYKGEFGSGYETKLAAVQQMIEGFTGTPIELGEDDMNRLDMKLGSSNLVRFMFAVHDRIGDLTPAGDNPQAQQMANVAPENAEARLNERMKDAEWRKKAKVAGSAEAKEATRLQQLMAQHRVSQQRA